jgi:hypothetical protein
MSFDFRISPLVCMDVVGSVIAAFLIKPASGSSKFANNFVADCN